MLIKILFMVFNSIELVFLFLIGLNIVLNYKALAKAKYRVKEVLCLLLLVSFNCVTNLVLLR